VTGVTPQELAPLLHAAYRRAYMAQVPGMPCPAWDEMPVAHGPRVAVAVQGGWLAAAREALARPGGGQEAAAERERIRQLAIKTNAVTVSSTGRMLPFEELLRRSPEENAAELLKVVESARAGLEAGHR
jgi:hypothetical protein